MEYQVKVCRRLARFLELIAYEVVNMGIEFQERFNNTPRKEGTWATLEMQKHFAETMWVNCNMTEEGISPAVNDVSTVKDVEWKYALLYNCGIGKYGITEKREGCTVIKGFSKGVYLGWEVKFFESVDEVNAFMKKYPNYTDLSLFEGFNKVYGPFHSEGLVEDESN